MQIDFASNDIPCHLDSADSCDAAALDPAGMLQFDAGSGPGNWGARIDLSNQGSLTIDSRAMIQAGAVRYWLRGPVVTQAIVEDRSPDRTFDVGFTAGVNGLHPIFVHTFYPGWAGVKSEFVLENMWTDRLVDQSYALSLKTGASGDSERYKRDTFTHYPLARWRKVFWEGNEPGTVRTDWNYPYMVAAGALPNYDVSVKVTNSVVNTLLANYLKGDRGDDFGESGSITKNFGDTGGRPELGWLPTWQVQYLLNPDERLEPMIAELANLSGHAPLHYREAIPDRYFCPSSCTLGANNTVNAFGRPVSLEARPTIWLNPTRLTFVGVQGSDRIVPAGTMSRNGWTVDVAHMPSLNYLPYLLSGDYYHYEEMSFWISYALADSDPGGDIGYGRHGEWGLANPYSIQLRGSAWALRSLTQAEFVAMDGSPEKEYIAQKIRNTAEFFEGIFDIENGNFPPADASCPGYASGTGVAFGPRASPWCHGRMASERGRRNPLGWFTKQADMTCPTSDFAAIWDCDAFGGQSHTWQAGYMGITLGMAVQMGFPELAYTKRVFTGWMIDGILSPDSLPYTIAGGAYAYYPSVLQKADGNYPATWADWKAHYLNTNTSTELTGNLSRNGNTFTVADWTKLARRPIWTRTMASGKITDVRISGRELALTFAKPHGLLVGDQITVSGASIAQLNGAWTVLSAPGDSQLTMRVGDTPANGILVEPSLSARTLQTRFYARIGDEVIGVDGVETDGTCNVNSHANFGTVQPSGGYQKTTQVKVSYEHWTDGDNFGHGYPWIMRSALSFAYNDVSPLGYNGKDAWDWVDANLGRLFGAKLLQSGMPGWAMIPTPSAVGAGAPARRGKSPRKEKTRRSEQ